MADDDESLDEILSSKETPESTEAQPEKTEPNRDEHGRFAPKGDEESIVEEQPEPAEEPEAETAPNAPVAAVIAERRKAQQAEERATRLERELAEVRGQVSVLTQQRPQNPAPQPEPVKPPPDFWEAPDKFVEHALNPFQQQMSKLTFRASRAEALAEFGKDALIAANDALAQAVKTGQVDEAALRATLSKSDDPVGDVVRWYQNSPAVREASIKDKLRAEIMAELGIDPNKQQPSTPSRNAPIVKVPPSLSRIPAGHTAPERDESLDEVLTQPRRARA